MNNEIIICNYQKLINSIFIIKKVPLFKKLFIIFLK